MRAVCFLTALAFFTFGGVLILHEPAAIAQADSIKSGNEIERKFDADLDRIEKKVGQVQRESPAKTPHPAKRLIKKNRAVHPIPNCLVNTVAVQTDSAVYSLPAKVYGNIAVVDGDDLMRVLHAEGGSLDAPVLVDTLIEETDRHISAWQAFKSFLSKPFKRKDHDKE